MNWEAKIVTLKKEKRIAVYFEKNAELITRIKKWTVPTGFNPCWLGIFQTQKKIEFDLG